MKTKINKVLGISLVFVLLAGLIVSAVPVSAGTLFWSSETIISPTNKVLEDDVINDIAIAADNNTVYAALANNKLYKSVNLGSTWTQLTIYTGKADLVALAPDSADIVAVVDATAAKVYISVNGGTSFSDLGQPTDGTTPMTVFKDVDISLSSAGTRYVAVGGSTAADGTALVYSWNYGSATPAWSRKDDDGGFTYATKSVVTAVKFSPNFPSDKILTCVSGPDDAGVATDDVLFQIYSYSNTKWNSTAGFTGYPVEIIDSLDLDKEVLVSSIALPSTYIGSDETTRIAFLGVATDMASTSAKVGGIYRVDDYTKKDLKTTLAVKSVAYNTDANKLVAGCYLTNDVWRASTPTATTVTPYPASTYKKPGVNPYGSPATSVTTNIIVAWAGSTVVAAGGGAEGGFSVSEDDGKSFNDISLINTTVVNIKDFDVSADGSTLYMLTSDAADQSLWRKDAAGWARVFDYTTASQELDLVRIAPDDAKVVYLADKGANNMFYTNDAGETEWKLRYATLAIQDVAVESARVLYVLGDSAVTVSKSTDTGFVWGTAVSTKLSVGTGYMIRSLGENKLIVGSTGGYVSYSTDGNTSWTALTLIIESGATNVQVTADADLKYVYACSDTKNLNVMRWQVGVSTTWTDILTSTMGTNYQASGIVLKDGVLYVLGYDANATESKMWISLSPTGATATTVAFCSAVSTLSPTTLATVEFKRTPQALKMTADHKAWAVDVTGTADKLCTFVDSIYQAGPALTAPTDLSTVKLNPITGHAYDVAYNWTKPSDNVTDYDLWIAFDKDFKQIVRKEESIKSTSTTVVFILGPYTAIPVATIGGTGTILEYMPATTYYWKVRVSSDGPIASPWSATRSFTVGAAEAPVVTPVMAPEILAPAPGATNVPVRTTFMWTKASGANTYDLQVSDNALFILLLVDETLISNNAWTLPEDLDYSTAYFWRVRASTSTVQTAGKAGPWVATGVFTTEAAPPAPEKPTPPVEIIEQVITPTWIYVIIAIGALLVIAVIILIVRTRRVA